jgi:hypothetical protein
MSSHAVFPACYHFKLYHIVDALMKLFHSLYFLTRIPKESMKLHCASRGAISRTTSVLTLARFRSELLHFTRRIPVIRALLSMHLRVSVFLRVRVTACFSYIGSSAS